MGRLGIISGTLALQEKDVFGILREETIETKFGAALVLQSPRVVFIPRHGRDPRRHILPHRIDHPANLTAMKKLNVDEVVGVNSTGSLKKKLAPGVLVIPDDFIMLSGGPTVFDNKPVHIAPVLNEGVRQKCIEAARKSGNDVAKGGVYWQTQGPRLETCAEIKLMARFADIVGMTMASEAIVAQELGLPYASICSIDNFAHGIGGKALTLETILQSARRSTDTIMKIIMKYLEGETA